MAFAKRQWLKVKVGAFSKLLTCDIFGEHSEPAKIESRRVSSKAQNAQTQRAMVSLRPKTQNAKRTLGCTGVQNAKRKNA